MGFVHLHCHSAYSLLEGTATPQAFVGTAKRCQMSALALTDHNALYGLVGFYTYAQKVGVKPLVGMEVDLDEWGKEQSHSLVLLARNMDGYRNLSHLATSIGLNTNPEVFAPAGFFEGEGNGEDEDGQPIPPWDTGLWGVSVFGFTSKPNKPKPIAHGVYTARKRAYLPRKALLSGRHARGLIALSGGRRGLVNSLVEQGKLQAAAKAAGTLVSAFGEGNFFIELDASCGSEEINRQLADLANSLGIPIVATNNVLYLKPEDASTAMALAVVRKGKAAFHGLSWEGPPEAQGKAITVAPDGHLLPHPDLLNEVGTERYFKTAEQMAEVFEQYPQAIANTHFIAEQCNVELPLHRPLFPSVDLSMRGKSKSKREVENERQNEKEMENESGKETPFSKLWKLCFAGATRRYRPLTREVISRLRHELEIIETLGFSPYFLVVYDIAHFARSHNIPIMARGSAASSLVAYVLGITQVDPIKHDLLFERFLNTSRAEFEMPDVDLDLCWRRRDEVLHYVYERYGRDHVAIVGTHITFRLRSAWREMAKVMGITPDRINRVANRLPHLVSAEDIADGSDDIPELEELQAQEMVETLATLELDSEGVAVAKTNAKAKEMKFRDETGRVAFELCKAIEGLPRHAGMHCGGVVISPASIPIADLVPLQRSARDPNLAITQYEKDGIESLGLVKMDLLGSRALTTLVDAVESSGLAKALSRGAGISTSTNISDIHEWLEQIPFDDEATCRLMAEANTIGCFQLESPGMRGLLKWLRPRSMADIATAISLFRPGPMEGGFLEIFMRRHLGEEPVTYPHPAMEPILKDTKGVILFQEQFLQLAHVLAGVELGAAEQLRKQLGKARSPEERANLGRWFVSGAIERGIDQLQAEKVWEVVAGYTGFGFCKAHACSYALTAYRSAYMKAHYPAHFMAAQINNQGGYYPTAVYVEDARRQGVEIIPLHVNTSGAWCEVPARTRSIRFGLQFIKGLSERTITLLLSERRSGGPFRYLQDLMSRAEMTPTEITALVKGGACDQLGRDFEAASAAFDMTMPAIAPIQGPLGEPMGASREYRLNRKQLLELLLSLLSVRMVRARGTAHRTNMEAAFIRAMPTGSDGVGLQIGMGDMIEATGVVSWLGQANNPKVLGNPNLHINVPQMEDFTLAEKLRLEQEAFGFALSCNEMEAYKEVAHRQGAVSSLRLAQYADREVIVAGVAVAGHRHLTKGGEWMLFLTLQDCDGLIEVVLFPKTYKDNGEVLANGGRGPYILTGIVQVSGKGRGIDTQLPADLRPDDGTVIKTHPVLIASRLRILPT